MSHLLKAAFYTLLCNSVLAICLIVLGVPTLTVLIVAELLQLTTFSIACWTPGFWGFLLRGIQLALDDTTSRLGTDWDSIRVGDLRKSVLIDSPTVPDVITEDSVFSGRYEYLYYVRYWCAFGCGCHFNGDLHVRIIPSTDEKNLVGFVRSACPSCGDSTALPHVRTGSIAYSGDKQPSFQHYMKAIEAVSEHNDEALAAMHAMIQAVRADKVTIEAEHQEIESYQPQINYDDMPQALYPIEESN